MDQYKFLAWGIPNNKDTDYIHMNIATNYEVLKALNIFSSKADS